VEVFNSARMSVSGSFTEFKGSYNVYYLPKKGYFLRVVYLDFGEDLFPPLKIERVSEAKRVLGDAGSKL
jgi:hypothetical protein